MQLQFELWTREQYIRFCLLLIYCYLLYPLMQLSIIEIHLH